MDTFTGIIEGMVKMSPAEVAAKIEKMQLFSICTRCPTNDFCEKKKGGHLFCAVGKSPCTLMKIAYTCPACTVIDLMGFERQFFCMKGKEKDQPGMQRFTRFGKFLS